MPSVASARPSSWKHPVSQNDAAVLNAAETGSGSPMATAASKKAATHAPTSAPASGKYAVPKGRSIQANVGWS